VRGCHHTEATGGSEVILTCTISKKKYPEK
jgi:hypothetical protein